MSNHTALHLLDDPSPVKICLSCGEFNDADTLDCWKCLGTRFEKRPRHIRRRVEDEILSRIDPVIKKVAEMITIQTGKS